MALRRFRYGAKCSIIIYFYLFFCLFIGWFSFDLFFNFFFFGKNNEKNVFLSYFDFNHLADVSSLANSVNFSSNSSFTPTNKSCNHFTCFNVYRCGFYERKLTVYVYPYESYIDEKGGQIKSHSSKENREILESIKSSRFNDNDSNTSCLFLPSFDTLNQKKTFRIEQTGRILASLPTWNGGENHLLFNFLPPSIPHYHNETIARDFSTGRAIVAGGGFSMKTFRRTFDISIPVFNSISQQFYDFRKDVVNTSLRPYLLVSTQLSVHSSVKNVLRQLAYDKISRFLLLDQCYHLDSSWYKRCDTEGNVYDYPQILESAQFCLVLDGSIEFSDALMTGCVPVVVSDSFLLPFFDVIDWKRVALVLYSRQLPAVLDILLNDITSGRAKFMQINGRKLYRAYFESASVVALTTLEILEERIFPEKSRSYEEWNLVEDTDLLRPPLFLPRKAPDTGFTAVILTYDRVATLFKIIEQLVFVKSLSKIIVVWNNPLKSPPHRSKWPAIGKPIQIIRTPVNKLTNRFLPFDDIETEAILSLDDDITMLNSDELEFAYQVWREFPTYLVGFPSRVHTLDPDSGSLVYNSEWTNNISMILTGAAFYHKKISKMVKNFVDDVMNCEDILMNFLIANVSGQPALKVTPRKKFRASEYGGHDLSTDSGHLKQRTDCLNKFESEFGGVKIKTVEFRVDPVLYKVDEVPDTVLSYKNVGPL